LIANAPFYVNALLFFIYFCLYRVPTLLTAFSPPEVATTPTIIQMSSENCVVDIYVSPSIYVYGCVYG
jgi:hypothetical protein